MARDFIEQAAPPCGEIIRGNSMQRPLAFRLRINPAVFIITLYVYYRNQDSSREIGACRERFYSSPSGLFVVLASETQRLARAEAPRRSSSLVVALSFTRSRCKPKHLWCDRRDGNGRDSFQRHGVINAEINRRG